MSVESAIIAELFTFSGPLLVSAWLAVAVSTLRRSSRYPASKSQDDSDTISVANPRSACVAGSLFAKSGLQVEGAQLDPILCEIQFLLENGHTDTAIDLLRSLRLADRLPSPACSRAVMQRLARSRSSRISFENLIEEMCLAGISADWLTESCMVRYICRGPRSDVNSAMASYSAMLHAGAIPDLSTIECLVAACLRARRMPAAQDLVLSLDDFSLRPTAALYASLIIACDAAGAAVHGTALERMRLEMGTDSEAMRLGYATAVHVCARNGRLDEALGLYADGRGERGLPLGPGPVAALLALALRTGDDRLASRLAAQACADGLAGSQGAVVRVAKMLTGRPGTEEASKRILAVLAGDDAEDLPPLFAEPPADAFAVVWGCPA